MATTVFGRDAELGAVDAVLAAGRRGLAALVLEGDPGIGKTTVWQMGIGRAAAEGYRVLSCRAAPTEARLSFTALGDLLAPVEPAAFDTLPDPQRGALDAALLRAESEGAAPNPRAIGTGIVSLLAELAASAPVLLAIDDLQWLDLPSARALEFALRRLAPHPIAVLATVRLGERTSGTGLLSTDLDGRSRSLRLGPLSLGALYRIVEDALGHGLPRPLLVKIERATGGNPFYTLEIARALETEGKLVAGQELPIPDDLRELAAKRLRKLPQQTREALLRVSALARPTISLVDPAHLAPAEEAGVARVRADGRIELAHPLFASALYAAASHERRRKLHGELAEIAGDVEERARHLMLMRASDEPDEHVAGVLHEAAEHALRRGAVEVAAELDEQSARRTPAQQIDVRWQRYLRAARHHLRAGDPVRSRAICEEVLGGSPASSVRAHALHLLAETYAIERAETAIPLLEEARACVGDDAGHAAQLEIALGLMVGAGLDPKGAHRHLIRAVELAERAADSSLIAEAIALKAITGLVSGQGLDEQELQRALALEDPAREVSFQMSASRNVAEAYEHIGRIDRARELFVKLRERLVARGDEGDLPGVLAHLAGTAWLAGDLEIAEREASDAERVAALTGVEIFRAFALMVRAMVRAIRGNSSGARADGTESLAVSEHVGWVVGVVQARYALGFLALSEANPEAAVAALEPVVTAIEALGVYEWPIAMSLPDAIEAFVATGELERATRLTDALASWGRKFDRPWALATSGRCRALLAAAAGELDSAGAAAAQALVAHERLPMPFELARTLLVQGQLLRRRGERRAGRETLQRALAIFEKIGAPLWAEKARSEIARIGVRRAPEELTEGEARVAELAAQGLTNPEIAGRLFMSRRTVEANLSRAYGKLGIHSRAELGATMAKRRAASSS
jgi:DNA-binding CsgD family transcriptional regulator